MALKIMGYKDSTIRKFGRWASDTWQIYIHSQIKNYQRALHKILAPPSCIKTFLLLIHLNDNNVLIETSLIKSTGQRRYWHNDTCTNN